MAGSQFRTDLGTMGTSAAHVNEVNAQIQMQLQQLLPRLEPLQDQWRSDAATSSAEEGQLRQAADAFDAAARALDAQREACTAKVRTLVASSSGGGLAEFSTFWGRYDGSGQAAMPATADACRELAKALRRFADEVEHTKASIGHKVEIAGAALVLGAVAVIFTFGASEAAAAAAAAVIADFAAAAGVALSATVTTIVSTALVGAAFGVVESVAIDALVVQPLSVALHEQKGVSFQALLHAGELGGAGGLLAGGAGGALSRLPALSATTAASLPRLSSTPDGLTRFTGTTGGRLALGAGLGLGLGLGTTEAVTGGDASGFDLLSGALGGMVAPGGRRRLLGEGTARDGSWSREGLTPDRSDDEVATAALAQAQGREPRITADLQALAEDAPGSGLALLEMRVKTADCYRAKVAGDVARARPRRSRSPASGTPCATRTSWRPRTTRQGSRRSGSACSTSAAGPSTRSSRSPGTRTCTAGSTAPGATRARGRSSRCSSTPRTASRRR